jgi:parvulin-like peptidyl-prolyl isomerase
LLAQKARELDIDVEPQVNQQWIELAKQNNFNTVREFEDAIKTQGMSPDAMRESLKVSLQRDAVIRQEVFGPIYRHITEPEAKETYQKNIAQFSTPAEVSLSEIFIGMSGRSSAEAEGQAKQAAAEAKRGGDFKALVQKYSDPTRKSKANQGVMGSFKQDSLDEAIAQAVSKLKAGEVSDPVFSQKQGGYLVLRVDALKPAAARPFEEVKEQIYSFLAYQKGNTNIQDYIKKLRRRAYIKVTDGYENLLPVNTTASKTDTKS